MLRAAIDTAVMSSTLAIMKVWALAMFLALAGAAYAGPNGAITLPSAGNSHEVTVQLGDKGGYGERHTFPEIRDWQSVMIELDRYHCFGTCPAYSIKLGGDGTIVYEGHDCVAVKGRRKAHIAPAAFADLVQKFRKADYFSLRDHYVADITDGPVYRTRIRFDGREKSVDDYMGEHIGMPIDVSNLEDAIDKAAGSDRWVWQGKRTCFGRPVDDTPLKPLKSPF